MKITKKEAILILDHFNVNTSGSPSKIKSKADELIDEHLCVPIIGNKFYKSKSKSTIKAKNN
jgi:hypothetical protein